MGGLWFIISLWSICVTSSYNLRFRNWLPYHKKSFSKFVVEELTKCEWSCDLYKDVSKWAECGPPSCFPRKYQSKQEASLPNTFPNAGSGRLNQYGWPTLIFRNTCPSSYVHSSHSRHVFAIMWVGFLIFSPFLKDIPYILTPFCCEGCTV